MEKKGLGGTLAVFFRSENRYSGLLMFYEGLGVIIIWASAVMRSLKKVLNGSWFAGLKGV